MQRHCGWTFTLHPADTLAGEISSQSRQASGIRIRRPERSLRRQRSRWTDAANCSQRRMQGRWLPVLGWAARLTSNYKELPGGSEGKASVCNAGDLGSIPELGRSPGEGNGNPLQDSCLKTPWTEEPRRLQFMVTQITGHDEQLHFHFHFKFQCKASLSTISTEHVKERQHWIPSLSGLLIWLRKMVYRSLVLFLLAARFFLAGSS